MFLGNLLSLCVACDVISPEMIYRQARIVDVIQACFIWISEFSSHIQNWVWFILAIASILTIVFSFFRYKRKSKKFTEAQISALKVNKKYIPGLFVEIDNTKEKLRYFVYGNKWRKRLIKLFNQIYENMYGDIFRAGCQDSSVKFRLRKNLSLEEVRRALVISLDFHERLKQEEFILKQEYKETEKLFKYVLTRLFSDRLAEIQSYVESAMSQYIVLTGSAGNGKTNLMCSLTELLLKLNYPVFFTNAKHIYGDCSDFFLDNVCFHCGNSRYRRLIYFFLNLMLTIRRRYFYIMIDALNENGSSDFCDNFSQFIFDLLRYPRFKIIVSCRSEYYKIRFRYYLIEKHNLNATEITLQNQESKRENIAFERMLRIYRHHFNYKGHISQNVKSMLSQQLLLLRIFFEAYQGSDQDVVSVHKYEIYKKYEEIVLKNPSTANTTHYHTLPIYDFLDKLLDYMLDHNCYSHVILSELGSNSIAGDVESLLDSSVLLCKSITKHPNTILSEETEEIYFVFDEMRDYFLAKQILSHALKGNLDTDYIFGKINQLASVNAPCLEGILQYIYMYFKSDQEVFDDGMKTDLCCKILKICDNLVPADSQDTWKRIRNNEFQNYSFRLIFSSCAKLEEFEIHYIRSNLSKNPREDGPALFYTMFQGALEENVNNIDLFIDIIFGLKSLEEIKYALVAMQYSNFGLDREMPMGLISFHRETQEKCSDCAKQIERLAELFIMLAHPDDSVKHLFYRIKNYFYGLPCHNETFLYVASRLKDSFGWESK